MNINTIKNFIINKPKNILKPEFFVRYIQFLSAFRLHSYQKLILEEFPTFSVHKVNYLSHKIYFQSEYRISRFMRGFKHAGMRMWNRYEIDEVLNGHTLKTLIDIGANIGEISYYADARYGSNVSIYCIEPDIVAIECIKNNLINCKFNLFTSALSNEQSKSIFWLKPENSDSSLHKPDGKSIKYEVTTETLDNIFNQTDFSRPALLKMDAEGHEPEVLLGGRVTLQKLDFVSIDAGLERSGKHTSLEVAKILADCGFDEVKISKNYIVTASRSSLTSTLN